MFTNSLAVSRVALLAFVSVSACRGTAHSDRRGPAEHSSSQALAGSKDPALKRCNAAREKARAALNAGAEPGQNFANVTNACADLYSEPGCANAFRRAASLPVEARAASIARACREAYCPKLAPPKPALCSPDEGQLPSRTLATWPELNTRILAFELNVPVEEAERLFPRSSPPVRDIERMNTVIPVQRATTDSGNAASTITVSLGVDANGRARTWIDGERPQLLPTRIDASNFAAIAASAKKRAATQVFIAVDERATHSQVVALIDALQQVGIANVSIQLLPSADQQNATKP